MSSRFVPDDVERCRMQYRRVYGEVEDDDTGQTFQSGPKSFFFPLFLQSLPIYRKRTFCAREINRPFTVFFHSFLSAPHAHHPPPATVTGRNCINARHAAAAGECRAVVMTTAEHAIALLPPKPLGPPPPPPGYSLCSRGVRPKTAQKTRSDRCANRSRVRKLRDDNSTKNQRSDEKTV